MKLSTSLAFLGTVAIALPVALSDAADDPGWYVGANIGQSTADIDDARITRSLQAADFAVTHINDHDRHFAFKVFGGYQFNRYFALEGGYFDLGRFGFAAQTLPSSRLTGDIEIRGANADLLGFLPFTKKLSAFARIGYNYAYAKDRFAGYGSVVALTPKRHEYSSNYKYGVGIQYAPTESWGLRAEVERYRIDDAVGNRGDIDLVSVGLLYRFGKSPAREVALTPTPAAPEPAVAVPPAAVPTESYCSILDIEFEINADEMQREEKEKLAVLGTFLNKYTKTTATIEGHTDNVGTSEENMKLSQRRAQSVVNYLETTFHIVPGRLTATGYGETRPVADNATESGKRMNRRIAAVIACATDIEGLTVAPARLTMALLMEFDRNEAEVRPQYRDELHKVAAFFNANPSLTATVEGHTSNLQTTPELALAISQRRAQNVVNYLVQNGGVASSRLTAKGFGQTRRFAYNTSLEGQQENRRVNIIINYPK